MPRGEENRTLCDAAARHTQKGQVRGVENKTAGRGQKKKEKKTLLALLIRSKEHFPIESGGELSTAFDISNVDTVLWCGHKYNLKHAV